MNQIKTKETLKKYEKLFEQNFEKQLLVIYYFLFKAKIFQKKQLDEELKMRKNMILEKKQLENKYGEFLKEENFFDQMKSENIILEKEKKIEKQSNNFNLKENLEEEEEEKNMGNENLINQENNEISSENIISQINPFERKITQSKENEIQNKSLENNLDNEFDNQIKRETFDKNSIIEEENIEPEFEKNNENPIYNFILNEKDNFTIPLRQAYDICLNKAINEQFILTNKTIIQIIFEKCEYMELLLFFKK